MSPPPAPQFYGHVSTAQEEGRQVFKWNAGEQVRGAALASPRSRHGPRLLHVTRPAFTPCLSAPSSNQPTNAPAPK